MTEKSSRIVSVVTIPAGLKVTQTVNGDYFHIVSVSDAVAIAVNGGGFTPCQAGLIHRQAQIDSVEFYNATGATVYVTLVYGRGDMLIAGQVALSASDLAQITPPAATITGTVKTIDDEQEYTGKNSVKVVNVGEADITVTVGDNDPFTLAPTEDWYIEAPRVQDVVADVTVDATDSSAKVVWSEVV